MKLAIVTDLPVNPELPKGGVESVSVNLVMALAAIDGLDVDVVTFANDQEEDSVSTWAGATVHRLVRPKGSLLLTSIGRGRKLISDYVSGLAPDVVHSHDTYGMMVRNQSCPTVFTVHGFIHGDIKVSRTGMYRMRAALWRLVETSSWADQQAIISISPYVREYLSGFTKSRIYDIDNPVSPSFFEVQRDEHPNTVFCAAAISRRKNTLGLIKAVNILVKKGIDVKLRWAGPVVENAYMDRITEYIIEKNLSDAITFLGQTPAATIRTELAHASVFGLVSREENSPMGIEEAMAVGIPVITSNLCGMPYMVDHGRSGFLVDQESPEDIASALAKILTNDELKDSMSMHSRKIAKERFHADVVAERSYAVYKELQEKAI